MQKQRKERKGKEKRTKQRTNTRSFADIHREIGFGSDKQQNHSQQKLVTFKQPSTAWEYILPAHVEL